MELSSAAADPVSITSKPLPLTSKAFESWFVAVVPPHPVGPLKIAPFEESSGDGKASGWARISSILLRLGFFSF